MINNKSVLGIIPARGKSKGLSRKNIVSLGRKPLIAWIIKAALKSKFIDKVIVSTDDKKIADVAKNYRAEVPFIRPSKLATDNSKTFPVIKHAINFLKSKKQNFDYVVLLEPTSPLTTNKDIDEALERLVRQRKIADAIVGTIINVTKKNIYGATKRYPIDDEVVFRLFSLVLCNLLILLLMFA